MKKRYLYSVLFGIPGFLVSGIISIIIFGFTAGALWIFVFGDNPWPSFIENTLPFLFVLVFLAVWLALVTIGFVTGKKLEQNPILNKKHILVSISVTVILIFFVVFQQFSVGNIGQKSDGERCSDYCSKKGYPASSMPPKNSGERICSCLDNFGVEIFKINIESIDFLK